MSVARIRGMRDLETQQVRKLPQRIVSAQRNAGLSDEGLCRLMGWRLTDLMAIKAGERLPSPAEMRALYGVFGKNRQGTLQTRWLDGAQPPLKPADWVILGDQTEITELDRLMVENRQLHQRIEELEAALEEYRSLETTVAAMTKKLSRRS
jgi:ribosome-binding protein aMBF1 (putative translation factor)